MSNTCHKCNKVFLRACNYKAHMKTHATVEEFQCKKCSKSFEFENNYREHMNTAHIVKTVGNDTKDLIALAYGNKPKNQSNDKKTKKILNCKYCSKKYDRRDLLRKHENAHLGIKAVECKLCHQKFAQKSYLKLHLKVHQGIKAFECPKCNLRFTQKSNVLCHLRLRHPINVNIKKKMLRCKFCSCFYNLKMALTQHIKRDHPEKYVQKTKKIVKKCVSAKETDHVYTGGYRQQVFDDVDHVDDDDDDEERVAIDIFLYYSNSLN